MIWNILMFVGWHTFVRDAFYLNCRACSALYGVIICEEIMASKMHLLQSKAAEASKLVSKHGCSYYKQLLEQNKQYIQEPPTVEKCHSWLINWLTLDLPGCLHDLVSYEIPLSSSMNTKLVNILSLSSRSKLSSDMASKFDQCFIPGFICGGSIPVRYEAFRKELDYVKQLFKNRRDIKTEHAGIAAFSE
ncbi:hypothetical protein C3L33_21758, partial [Rhododendron williamsianum]